jgi:hypothetical protein
VFAPAQASIVLPSNPPTRRFCPNSTAFNASGRLFQCFLGGSGTPKTRSSPLRILVESSLAHPIATPAVSKAALRDQLGRHGVLPHVLGQDVHQ